MRTSSTAFSSLLTRTTLILCAALALASCDEEKKDGPDVPTSNTVKVKVSVTDYGTGSQNDYTWPDGTRLHVFDAVNPTDYLGSASYSAESNAWIFDPYTDISEVRRCRIIYSEALNSTMSYDIAGYNSIIIYGSNPTYRGDGILSIRNGSYNLSGGLRPITAKISFSGAPDSYMVNNANYVYVQSSDEVQSTLLWVDRRECDSHSIIYSNTIPRVKIGDMVYAYTGPEANNRISAGNVLTIPFPTSQPSMWQSADYVHTETSHGSFNIYPSSTTKTIVQTNMQSAIGFLIYLEYEWSAYGGSLTPKDGIDYPFYCRLTTADGTADETSFGDLDSGNIEWTQSLTWDKTSFKKMEFIAEDYDVNITVDRVVVANF